jgi:FkbM family methyltransferase
VPASGCDGSKAGLRRRMARLKLSFGFSWRLGGSLRERTRLFYHAWLKPRLVFRGYRAYAPERVLCFSARLTRHRKIQFHARDNGLDVGTFAEFFSAQYQVLPPELPPLEPKVIYDIGANIGVASLYFSARYPGTRFYGFEPLPANYEVCRLNYRNLEHSEVYPWAVGAQEATTWFQFREQDPRGGQISSKTMPGGALDKRIEVQVFSLAEIIRTKGLAPPDFLKIDVEGAELDVLKGLGEGGRTVRRMLIETHGEHLEEECLKWLRGNGFVVRHLDEAAPGYAAVWCDRAG